jgi:hypothetical protein
MYGDGVLKHTQSVLNQFPFTLPDGRNYVVAYELETTSKVRSVTLASSLQEMSQ